MTVKGGGGERLLEQPGVQKDPEQGTQGKKSLSSGLCTSPAHVLYTKKTSCLWSNDCKDEIIFHTVNECHGITITASINELLALVFRCNHALSLGSVQIKLNQHNGSIQQTDSDNYIMLRNEDIPSIALRN